MTVGPSEPALDCPPGENTIAPDRPAVPMRPTVRAGAHLLSFTRRSAWTSIRKLPLLILVAALVAACGPLGDEEEPTVPAATSIPNATVAPSPRAESTPRVVASPTVVASIASLQIRAASPEVSPAAQPATPRPATPAASTTRRATPRVSTPRAAPTDEAVPAGAQEPPVAEDCEAPADLPEVVGEVQREATETVNVRGGPGLDCELVTQIEEGTRVIVESGPVEASGRLWVLVTVNGDQGWVAEEFVPGEEVTRGGWASLFLS